MGKMTKAQRRTLDWFAERGEVKLFGQGDPSLIVVKRLAASGLLTATSPAAFGFIRYAINDAGRAALKDTTND